MKNWDIIEILCLICLIGAIIGLTIGNILLYLILQIVCVG